MIIATITTCLHPLTLGVSRYERKAGEAPHLVVVMVTMRRSLVLLSKSIQSWEIVDVASSTDEVGFPCTLHEETTG